GGEYFAHGAVMNLNARVVPYPGGLLTINGTSYRYTGGTFQFTTSFFTLLGPSGDSSPYPVYPCCDFSQSTTFRMTGTLQSTAAAFPNNTTIIYSADVVGQGTASGWFRQYGPTGYFLE